MPLKSALLILKQYLSSDNWTTSAPLFLNRMKRTGDEKRLGFRVIVADLPEHVQRQITTTITLAGQSSPATLVNLSLSGMLVADLDLDVKAGDTVTIALDYDGRSAILVGAVIREVDRGSVGLYFPESIKDGEFDPPVRLSNLHRRLERLWLKSREK